MPEIEQNGPDFKYVVTYKRLDQDDAVEHVAVVQHPEAWHYVVPDQNLGIYRPFRITVKANNAVGDSNADLNSVIGWSGEDGQTQRILYCKLMQNLVTLKCASCMNAMFAFLSFVVTILIMFLGLILFE